MPDRVKPPRDDHADLMLLWLDPVTALHVPDLDDDAVAGPQALEEEFARASATDAIRAGGPGS